MTRNLRISLAILSIGFAVEGAGELYTKLGGGTGTPSANVLTVLPLLFTAVGLLFVWIGREEWSEVHRDHVRAAHRVFAATLLGGVVAAAVLGLLVAVPSLGTPTWAVALFGAAVGSLVFGTFVTYAYIVVHLTSNPGRVAVGLALAWAFAISALVAVQIAGAVPTILADISARRVGLPTFVTPVEALYSYLFLSYFLLLAAYLIAHGRVAQGPPAAGRPAPSVPTGTTGKPN